MVLNRLISTTSIGIECQQLDPAFKLPDDFLYSTSTTPLGNITLVINADSHVHGVEPLDDYADDKTAIPDVIVVNGTPYTLPPITEVDTVCDECKKCREFAYYLLQHI